MKMDTRSILAIGIVTGWLAVSIMVFVFMPDEVKTVVGGWIGLAGAAVREFFGAPGPNGDSHAPSNS